MKGNLVQKHLCSPCLHVLGAQKLATTHPTVILLCQVKICYVSEVNVRDAMAV